MAMQFFPAVKKLTVSRCAQAKGQRPIAISACIILQTFLSCAKLHPMKRSLLFLLLLSLGFSGFAQKESKLKKVLELKMPEGPGRNGSGITYHPDSKRYYATIAGNDRHPLAIFDSKGKRLTDDDQKALFDVRGLWWSPTLKKFCANGYADKGWITYKLDKKGVPEDIEQLYKGMVQPDDQSVAAFNPRSNDVFFLSGQLVWTIPAATGMVEDEDIRLYVGATNRSEALDMEFYEDDEYLSEDYNPTLIYTGVQKGEFGLLNHYDKQIELYDRKTGYMTQKLILPDDAPAPEMLCFGFANGIYWLYDKDARTWVGYK